jgi:hypothetical protein
MSFPNTISRRELAMPIEITEERFEELESSREN